MSPIAAPAPEHTPVPPLVPLDRAAFIKPIAHRGLHDKATGVIENTASAFAAGLARGLGVECDLQPAADGTPFVFHDATFDRLLDTTGRVDARTPSEIAALRYRSTPERVLSFAEFLELAAGRGPLLVEIKSEWAPPQADFLRKITALAASYKGPLALMSFDPAVMAVCAALAPHVPRGIVAGVYAGPGWDVETLGVARAERLTHLLDSRAAKPSFYAYDVKALPTPVTRYVRDVQGLPLFTWTVRTADDRAIASKWADAAIFEGEVAG
jgi:glycerophosphoryl diester phosphodiesterase